MEELTKAEQFAEYIKCVKDPVYYAEKYCQVYDQTKGGFQPFKLFDKQKELIGAYKNHQFNIVLKPRQAGVSTTTAMFCAATILFGDVKKPEKILIVANKRDTAVEFLKKVKAFVAAAPLFMFGGESPIVKDNEGYIELTNGSSAKSVATSVDALRGYTPTIMVMDEAAFIENGSEVWTSALPTLSCLVEDSYILTENGLMLLKDIVKEKNKIGFTNIEPIKVVDKYNNLTEATETFKSEFAETYKIKTKLGIELEGSYKHRIIGGDGEWKFMPNLTVGDEIKIAYNQNIFGKNDEFFYEQKIDLRSKPINIPTKLSKNLNFVYFLGLFLAEGNFTKDGMAITNGDKVIEDFIINDEINFGKKFKKSKDYHFYMSSIILHRWLIEFGFKWVRAPFKEIPKFILGAKKEIVVEFLRGMFDGDGCAEKNCVKYTSTSKKMVEQLHLLLLNFGIISIIRENISKPGKNSVCTNKEKLTHTFNIMIYGENARKFYQEIGFKLERKQIRYNNISDILDNTRNIILERATYQKWIKDEGINTVTLRKNFRFAEPSYYNSTRNPTFETKVSIHNLKKLKSEVLTVEENINQIDTLLEEFENYYIDEIVLIEKKENWTYDLHVPETNSYISNGIISHNTGGKGLLVSTPNGLDDLYYAIYNGAKTGKNNFHVTEMRWYEDPRFNKDLKWIKGDNTIIEFDKEKFQALVQDGYKPTSSWYEDMCRQYNGDILKIAQELDGNFNSSGNNVISEEYLGHQEKTNIRPPIRTEGFDNNIWIWEEPINGCQYICGADVSSGSAEDYSTFTIIKMDTGEQVLEYQGKIPPDILGEMLFKYCNKYQAHTIVDITGGLGQATVIKLRDLGFDFLHYSDPKNSKYIKDRMSKYSKQDLVPGFIIGANRPLIFQELERSIRMGEFCIRSQRLINELRTFVYLNGRPDHMRGYHDDLVVAVGLCLFVSQHSFKSLKKHNSQTAAMLDSWGVVETPNNVTPQPYIPPSSNNSGNITPDAYRQYGWLFGK